MTVFTTAITFFSTIGDLVMQRSSSRAGLLLAAFVVLFVTACRDELPTAPGEDLFPRGTRAATHVLELPVGAFLQEIGRFTGYTSPRDAGYLLVADRFDEGLIAHSLARFTGFPTSVTYSVGGVSQTDSVFVYGAGQLVAPVDTAASAAAGEVQFQLWSLAEPWDPASVSWQRATDTTGVQIPWSVPGGTRGQLLSQVTWPPGDDLPRDTLSFALDSLTVEAMAAADFPGVVVTVNGSPARFQLRRMTLRTTVHPASRPDTTLAQTIAEGPQTFIFTPEPPQTADSWYVGGVRSARVLFRVDLGRRFPCPAATGVAPCATAGDSLRLFDVALNQASLLLQPLPVTGGFRPLRPADLVLRRVGEPELGRQAPLGDPISQVTVPPDRFAAATDSTVAIPLIGYLLRLPASDTTALSVALLAEPEGGAFGVARFAPQPRLRLVYTLPLTRVSQ